MSSQLIASERTSFLFIFCIFVTIACLVLGGGTHSGFLGDALIQILAIPLLLIAIYQGFSRQGGLIPRTEMLLCLCIAAVPVVQIIPVPVSFWAHLPERANIIEAFALTGLSPDWHPISVIPESTALSALSLIPPLAIFLAARQLDTMQRRYLVAAVMVFAGFSVFLGLGQIASGEQSPLRFYEVTNPSEAVGFFANRNHFAALLYVALVLASTWAIDAALTLVHAKARDRLETSQVFALVGSMTLMFILAAAQIMARSRAGIGLTLLAIIAVAVLIIIDPRNTARKTSLKFFGGATIAALLFVAPFGISRFAERLAFDPLNDTRLVFARNTLAAARSYFPFGAGMGTFPDVYAMFEQPKDLIFNSIANHAHDDLLELWMEAGIPGMIVLAILLGWIIWHAMKVWNSPDRRILPVDHLLARAASISIGLLFLHSLLDYPLRTTAIMSVMAICCALLTTPYPEQEIFMPAPERQIPRRRHGQRHRSIVIEA